MRDPVKTPPRDTVHDPMREPKRGGGTGRWIWIGVLVLLGLVLLFWFFGMTDDTADVVDVTPSATVPADEVVVDPQADAVAIQPTTDPAPDPEAETGTIPSTPPE